MLAARVRDECLNINTCWSLTHARVVITGWKDEYNHHRRHSALGYEAPGQLGCRVYPPITDSHSRWVSYRGPASHSRVNVRSFSQASPRISAAISGPKLRGAFSRI